MLTEQKMPFALIGRTRDPTGLYCVDIDFDASMELAIEHLVELGHRSTVLLSGSQEQQSYRQYGRTSARRPPTGRWPSEHGIQPVIMRCGQSARPAGTRPPGWSARLRGRPRSWSPTRRVPPVWSPDCGGGQANPRRHLGDQRVDLQGVALACDPPLTLIVAPGVELGQLGVEALLRQLVGGEPIPPTLRAGVFEPGASTGPVA